MADRWVVNASPLIVLAKIAQLELLPRLAAKQRGFISHVRPLFEELLRTNFHITPLLLQRALDLSGES